MNFKIPFSSFSLIRLFVSYLNNRMRCIHVEEFHPHTHEYKISFYHKIYSKWKYLTNGFSIYTSDNFTMFKELLLERGIFSILTHINNSSTPLHDAVHKNEISGRPHFVILSIIFCIKFADVLPNSTFPLTIQILYKRVRH